MGSEALMEIKEHFQGDLVQRRQRALRAFEAWETAHRLSPPFESVIAQLDAILDLMPKLTLPVRVRGDYIGVCILHERLALIGKSA
jgi:hypothetical protein